MTTSMECETEFDLLDEETQHVRYELAVRVLRNMDPHVTEILLQIPFAALYIADLNTQRWKRAHIEGALYCARRSTPPTFRLFILNKLKKDNFIEDITERHEVEVHKQFVFIWSPHSSLSSSTSALPTAERLSLVENHGRRAGGSSYAIWCYFADKCDKLKAFVHTAVEELHKESTLELREAHRVFSQIIKEFGSFNQTEEPFNGGERTVGDAVDVEASHTACNSNVKETPVNDRNATHCATVHPKDAGQVLLNLLKPQDKRESTTSPQITSNKFVTSAESSSSPLIPSPLQQMDIKNQFIDEGSSPPHVHHNYTSPSCLPYENGAADVNPRRVQNPTAERRLHAQPVELSGPNSSEVLQETETHKMWRLLHMNRTVSASHDTDGGACMASTEAVGARQSVDPYLISPLQLLTNQRSSDVQQEAVDKSTDDAEDTRELLTFNRKQFSTAVKKVVKSREFHELLWRTLKSTV